MIASLVSLMSLVSVVSVVSVVSLINSDESESLRLCTQVGLPNHLIANHEFLYHALPTPAADAAFAGVFRDLIRLISIISYIP